MKQPPHGATFEKRKFKKVEFLKGVYERLENDVGNYFLLLQEKRQNDSSFPLVGFWGSIRLLMPVIETVAEVYSQLPQAFLDQHLNIKTPYLVWDLFRHSLIHNDLMQHGTYQNKTVTWSILMCGQGHVMQNKNIGIDVISLYEDLKMFLKDEIAKNDQTEIGIDIGVIYQTTNDPNPRKNIKQEIIDDFNKL